MTDFPSDRVGRSCDNYALKLSNGRGAVRRDGNIRAQAEHYASTQVRMGLLRSMTAVILDSHGVPSIVRPFYYSFVLKLAKFTEQEWSGESLHIEGRLQVDLWAARGLERNILVEVALQVLNMDLTGPEPGSCAADDARVESKRE